MNELLTPAKGGKAGALLICMKLARAHATKHVQHRIIIPVPSCPVQDSHSSERY
jgi:hypothetical protein